MRRAVLVIGIIVLAGGIVLAILPRDDSLHVVVADRAVTDTGNWIFSGPFSVHPGMEVSVSWTSNRMVAFGITDSLSAFEYTIARAPPPALVVSDSGTGGHVDVTFTKDDSYVFAARLGSGSGPLSLTVDGRSHQPWAYLPWGVLLSGFGALLTVVGFTTSPRARDRPPSEFWEAEASIVQRYCPSCGGRYDRSLGRFCPRDDTELKPLPER